MEKQIQPENIDKERIHNPSYNEQDFEVEVEAHRQFSIKHYKELLSKEEEPVYREKYKKILSDYNDPEMAQHFFIYEFGRLMPMDVDREHGVINKQLQEDLDRIIREHYDYDKYVLLKKRKDELTILEREEKFSERGGKLSEIEEKELQEIGSELDKYDFKLLYIEMRKLGYTQKELHTE